MRLRRTYRGHAEDMLHASSDQSRVSQSYSALCPQYGVHMYILRPRTPPNTPPPAGVRSCIWLQAVPANRAASPGLMIVIPAGAMLHPVPLGSTPSALGHFHWPVRPASAVHPSRWIAICGTVVWRVGLGAWLFFFFFSFFSLFYFFLLRRLVRLFFSYCSVCGHRPIDNTHKLPLFLLHTLDII